MTTLLVSKTKLQQGRQKQGAGVQEPPDNCLTALDFLYNSLLNGNNTMVSPPPQYEFCPGGTVIFLSM